MIGLGVCALLLYVVLGALNLAWGDLNQDEGWYLYAARQVHDGRLPYLDFAFTQGPVLPFVYSCADGWVRRWGVAGGRLFTFLLGFAGSLGAAWIAARTAPDRKRAYAALLAFTLIAGNVYQSYFTTVVKTYSLGAVLLVSGLLALSFARSRGGIGAVFLSGFFLALAAGTRLSAGAALPVAGLYLLIERRRLGDSRWLAFGVGGLLGLVAVSAPFLAVARDGFLFGVFEYHSARSAGGLVPLLVYKVGFLSRMVQAYFLPVCIGAALVLLRGCGGAGRSEPPSVAPERMNAALWGIVLGVTLVHLAAPFPYEDYQVMLYPLFAAALAVALVAVIPERWALWLLLAVFAVSTASAFSSPINQSWVIQGRDRIWWRLKDEPALKKLHKVALWLNDRAPAGSVLLTQDTYLAVEAGLSVPDGMEMGPFSYYPDFPRERAERLRVLNRDMMKELLTETDAPYAAFSGYGLSIHSPDISELPEPAQRELWAMVDARYDEAFVVPNFGQALTTLRVMRKKP